MVRNCDTPICPYAGALTGPVCSVRDTLVKHNNICDAYVDVYSYCSTDVPGEETRLIVGEKSVTLRAVSDIACEGLI